MAYENRHSMFMKLYSVVPSVQLPVDEKLNNLKTVNAFHVI